MFQIVLLNCWLVYSPSLRLAAPISCPVGTEVSLSDGFGEHGVLTAGKMNMTDWNCDKLEMSFILK